MRSACHETSVPSACIGLRQSWERPSFSPACQPDRTRQATKKRSPAPRTRNWHTCFITSPKTERARTPSPAAPDAPADGRAEPQKRSLADIQNPATKQRNKSSRVKYSICQKDGAISDGAAGSNRSKWAGKADEAIRGDFRRRSPETTGLRSNRARWRRVYRKVFGPPQSCQSGPVQVWGITPHFLTIISLLVKK
jgi:hypothetical protein